MYFCPSYTGLYKHALRLHFSAIEPTLFYSHITLAPSYTPFTWDTPVLPHSYIFPQFLLFSPRLFISPSSFLAFLHLRSQFQQDNFCVFVCVSIRGYPYLDDFDEFRYPPTQQ
ncbi:hypothetical protein HGRIS_005464 [Hohenbuehelia grisea]|uniref:Uncharacterized protein n=1 Tax=Hohenbuehelia grisea TaxID=104357 RepID=A0ABR3JX34_9AGAR